MNNKAGNKAGNKRLGIIYKAINKINNKVYIGQTIGTLENRESQHWSAANGRGRQRNIKFYRALRKYGRYNFDWMIIRANIPKSLLDIAEKEEIKKYDSFKNGYNSDLGGKSRRGYKPTKKTIAKCSGQNSVKAKLTDKDVKMILKMYKYCIGAMLADMFGVSERCIESILHGDTYKNIKRPKYLKKIAKERKVAQWYSHVLPKSIGEGNPKAKLKEKQVKKIKKLHSNKTMSIKELAEKFNVGITAIKNITSGKTWKHIK